LNGKVGAVLARVSTEPQNTLDSQAAKAKAELEKRGYVVPAERILKVDWTSLDLFNCPQFQELRGWILNHEIQALGIFDRDRLNAIGLQRLVFLSECQENGVELVICQGPPILDEPEGQLVELALAIGKQRQVLRAQQGSRDALRERATIKGLPATLGSPYGYHWNTECNRLITNDRWEIRELIIRSFLAGGSVKSIIRELARRSIPSPKGNPQWSAPTIVLILKDTVNFGEYRALKRENVLPKERRGNTYGKTSSKHHPGIPLPNIVVEKPVISQDEHRWILKRLEHNKLNARRNSRRDYLLKGLIYYEGDNVRYNSLNIKGISWAYRYHTRKGWSDNPRKYLPGRKLESLVEAKARDILTGDLVLEQELGWRADAIHESISRLNRELKRLDRKGTENLNAETSLAGLLSRGKVSEEAYDRQRGLLLAERRWITEERARIGESLAQLNKQSISMVGLEQLRQKMAKKLSSTDFADRRFVLEALDTKVIVTTEGALEIEFTIGEDKGSVNAIVNSIPLNACPQYSVVLF